MTVPSNKTREDYVGDGATTEWDYTFKIFNDSELVVIYTDDEDIDYELTLNTDYTVTEAGHPDGGKVKLQSGGTLSSATLTSSEKLSILRSLPVTQLVDLRNQRAFFADTHEDVFDRLTILIQQELEQGDRSVRLPQSINSDDVATELPKPVGGRAIGWNSAGDALVNLEDLPADAQSGSKEDQVLQWNPSTEQYEARDIPFDYAVDSVSALRAGSYPSSLDRIWLSGYYGVGTSGGGPLYRDSADTTTADNGGTVFVDADGVRWKRPDIGLDPEHATDSGTDAFVSGVHTGTHNQGATVTRDFQSANTTTTPTLDSLTITTKDGSALWANALSGVHTFQLASDGNSWLVLDPNPNGGDQPASVTYVDDNSVGASVSPALTLNDAMWSWWAKPIAIRHNDKLFFAFTVQDGGVGIAQFDYVTHVLKSRILSENFSPDDHNAGGIVVDDNNLAVVYPGRNHDTDTQSFYYFEADTPDIDALSNVQTINVSVPAGENVNYPNVYAHNTSFVMIHRGSLDPGDWYAHTNDWPFTAWDNQVKLFDSAKVAAYFATRRSRSTPSRINFVLGWHPETETHADLYIGYLDGASSDPWDVVSDGTVIGNCTTGTGLPFDESQLEKVYDADEGGGEKTRLFDVHDDTVAFASYTGDGSDGMYHVARKSGGSWTVVDIVATGLAFQNGSRQYFGGIAIDDADPDMIYVSRESDGEWILEQYSTPDNGSTWEFDRVIEKSVEVTARPMAEVRSQDSEKETDLGVLFFQGRYNRNDFKDSHTRIMSEVAGRPISERRGKYLAIGDIVNFSEEGNGIDVPVKLPEGPCQFEVTVSAYNGPESSTDNARLHPNDVKYNGEFNISVLSVAGGTSSAAEVAGADEASITSGSGTIISATMTISYGGASKERHIFTRAGYHNSDGNYTMRHASTTWSNTNTPWDFIGRIFVPNDSWEWHVSVRRIL